MMRDFTLHSYQKLLEALQQSGYQFLRVTDYFQHNYDPNQPFVILRHDVDKRPQQCVHFAQIEHAMGIRSTFYFRVIKGKVYEKELKAVLQAQHEVGYHYEDLYVAKGDSQQATVTFSKNLAILRQFYPVQTIVMHGTPHSKIDNKTMWQNVDYRAFGITSEPYLDIDFSTVFYLTDTGGCWDGYKYSVRDKIAQFQPLWEQQGFIYHSTQDIILALQNGTFPSRVLLTTHPQRWLNNPILWAKERLIQHIKNYIKQWLISLGR